MQENDMWYTAKNYPHGAGMYRRHVKRGMPAILVGKGWKTRVCDAERFWETLKVVVNEDEE